MSADPAPRPTAENPWAGAPIPVPECGLPWTDHPTINGEPYCAKHDCPARSPEPQHTHDAKGVYAMCPACGTTPEQLADEGGSA